jgi:hypothetical protein
MRKPILDDISSQLKRGLRADYPDGSRRGGCPDLGVAQALVTATIDRLDHLLDNFGPPIRIGLDQDKKAYICGFIIYDMCTGRTHVLKMSISPSLVRIDGKPVYLAHENAALMLVNHVEAVIDLVINGAESGLQT